MSYQYSEILYNTNTVLQVKGRTVMICYAFQPKKGMNHHMFGVLLLNDKHGKEVRKIANGSLHVYII